MVRGPPTLENASIFVLDRQTAETKRVGIHRWRRYIHCALPTAYLTTAIQNRHNMFAKLQYQNCQHGSGVIFYLDA